MRQVGTLDEHEDARRLTSYLITQGIASHAEQDGDSWAIWVRDENDMERARTEFSNFVAAPDHQRYQGAAREAEAILREEQKKREQARKNVVTMRDRWARPASRRLPLVFTMIVLSVLVYLITDFGGGRRDEEDVYFELTFSSLTDYAASDRNPLASIQQGELWRLITPIFLHPGGILHLLFNVYVLYFFGGQTEMRIGTFRFALLALVLAIFSNCAQALLPVVAPGLVGEPLLTLIGTSDPFFGGMSGVNYGLFGYVWIRSRMDPSSGFFIDSINIAILIGWLVFCFTGLAGPIANIAHLAGLLAGLMLGYLPMLLGRGR